MGTLLTLVLMLGGCVDEGTGPSGGRGGPQAPQASPTFDETTGAITGQVLTEDQLPIAGAEVGLIGGAAVTTTTDAQGNYALSNLEPGEYQVQANKVGFTSFAKTALVEAGKAVVVDFILEQLAGDVPYHRTVLTKATLSGLMWKVTPTCIYTDVNPLVKTCGGVRLSCDPENACEVHLGDDKEFTADWQTIIGEVRWTPQSGATGKGFSFDINAPNVTRGSGGSINQASPYTYNVATGSPPIKIRIDKADLASRGIAESDWNNYEKNDCTAMDPDDVGNCDWFWRIFPAACDLNICNSGFGPDYGIGLDNIAEIYFTYFIKEPAPADFSALPEG